MIKNFFGILWFSMLIWILNRYKNTFSKTAPDKGAGHQYRIAFITSTCNEAQCQKLSLLLEAKNSSPRQLSRNPWTAGPVVWFSVPVSPRGLVKYMKGIKGNTAAGILAVETSREHLVHPITWHTCWMYYSNDGRTVCSPHLYRVSQALLFQLRTHFHSLQPHSQHSKNTSALLMFLKNKF